MTSRLILVGQVGGAFGVRGEVRVQAYTADPLSLLAYSPLEDETGRVALTLTAGRVVKCGLVASAREVETREQAQALRGLRLYIERDRLPPAEDEEFYLADLIGLTVRSPSGETLGLVKSIADFGAGDLLEVAPADGSPSWWTPFSHEVVPEVRIADGWLTAVRPAESDS